jgi:serine/threonine protein kinase
VCRVYDVVETDSGRFITTEFIDGKDLTSLLRPIGRLPAGKASEIARQIACKTTPVRGVVKTRRRRAREHLV